MVYGQLQVLLKNFLNRLGREERGDGSGKRLKPSQGARATRNSDVGSRNARCRNSSHAKRRVQAAGRSKKLGRYVSASGRNICNHPTKVGKFGSNEKLESRSRNGNAKCHKLHATGGMGTSPGRYQEID